MLVQYLITILSLTLFSVDYEITNNFNVTIVVYDMCRLRGLILVDQEIVVAMVPVQHV